MAVETWRTEALSAHTKTKFPMNNPSLRPMRALLTALALCTLLPAFFTSCSESKAGNSPGGFTYETLKPDLTTTVLTYKNLRLYPIYAKEDFAESGKQYGKYLSLEKALKDDKVSVSEKSMEAQGSDEVNKLFVENLSSDTVLLLAGEVVKGGKQDRTLAKDVVLPPGKGKVDLDVFCVEQGRWTEKDENRAAGKPNEEKKFKQVTSMVKPSVRKNATVEKEQTKVWQKVEEANVKAGNQSGTSAYTAFDENTDYRQQEREYLEFFRRNLPDDERLLGVLAVTGDRVIGCDVFATRQLFLNAWGNLLPSFINEAIYDGAPVTISEATVKAYADKLLKSERAQQQFLEKNGNLYKHNDRVLHLVSY